MRLVMNQSMTAGFFVIFGDLSVMLLDIHTYVYTNIRIDGWMLGRTERQTILQKYEAASDWIVREHFEYYK